MLPIKYLFENYELAKECLKSYNHTERYLDEMLRHFRISSNAVYPFYTENGAKVCYLRLSPTAEKPPEEVAFELKWISWLLEKGYPVMKPYPMKNGKLCDVITTKWGEYNVSCFEEMDGETLEDTEGSLALARGFGEMLAALHNLSAECPFSDARKSHSDLLNEVRERLERYQAPKMLLDAHAAVANELSGLEINKENYGLIHYDFEPDNVLWDPDSAQFGVIDLDDAIRCWYALDVARAIDAMDDVVDEEMKEQAVAAFLEGYRGKRAFPEEQLALLPLMRRLVALQEYTTILHVLSETAEEEPEWLTQIRQKLNGRAAQIRAFFSAS